MPITSEDKTKKNLYPRTCQICGVIFAGGPRAWYCPDCRMERQAAAKKAYNARKRTGKIRKIGSRDICQECGAEYIVTGSLQKYCEKCAVDAMQEIDRRQGMEYYNKNKGNINPKRNDLRQMRKHCAVCGCEISAVGGRIFCENCKKIGFEEKYKAKHVSRNIQKRGESYIVYVHMDGKRIYVKCTIDRSEAFRLRDLADEKKKAGILNEWLEKIKEKEPGYPPG